MASDYVTLSKMQAGQAYEMKVDYAKLDCTETAMFESKYRVGEVLTNGDHWYRVMSKGVMGNQTSYVVGYYASKIDAEFSSAYPVSTFNSRESEMDRWVIKNVKIQNKNMQEVKVAEIQKQFLDEDTQKLIRAGIIDQYSLTLSPKGADILNGLIFAANKAALITKADEILAEIAKKNN